ncbi:MAG: calcium/sodium antiporter [Acidimicrobiia bacterium]|nr:calcium/sodium antiporter [Acidimicrobiia bacterium]
MFRDILLVLVGLVLLTVAADRLVLAAARLAKASGLSPILIGAVVVGLGTSLPEMLVSGLAAARPGGLDLALGNIVGSNVANLALVLGLSVLMSPITGQRFVLRREGSLVMVASLLLALLAWNGRLGLVEGIVLGFGMFVALWLLISWSRADSRGLEMEELVPAEDFRPGVEVLFGLGSLGLTLLGARFLVVGAESVARELGVSEAVIGLTLVAVGTSLPELATAIAAARRKENDLVLGNVLGSNLFNALAVGGVAGIVGNGALTTSFRGPLVGMVAVTALAGGLAVWGQDRLSRVEGVILLATYPLVLALI